MLLDFKFKNFMSFGNKCNFSMIANSDKSHLENMIKFKKNNISMTKMIYGANASGKSCFIKAMEFVINFIKTSNYLLENNIIPVTPFKFRKDSSNIPSEFEISFIVDNIKYIYFFSCTRKKVIDERLDVFYTSKSTRIFERTNTSEYKFTKDIKILNDIKNKNSDNKLFLVTSATWNYVITKPIVNYLLNNIVFSNDTNQFWNFNLDKIYENNDFDDYKNFCLKLLNDADFSINDFIIEKKKDNEEESESSINTIIYSLKTFHNVKGKLENENYSLDLSEESFGTTQIFMISPMLYNVFKNGKTIFFDEIDKSLHPILVKHIVKMFLNKDINTNNSQLIANTHDTNLLDLEIFRRDEILFTERNFENGITEMYPLSDFSPRIGENIEKSYLLGRFGAIPFIKEN